MKPYEIQEKLNIYGNILTRKKVLGTDFRPIIINGEYGLLKELLALRKEPDRIIVEKPKSYSTDFIIKTNVINKIIYNDISLYPQIIRKEDYIYFEYLKSGSSYRVSFTEMLKICSIDFDIANIILEKKILELI
ncbi:MAG: hypothetical protein K9H48_07935 [Melioribacteraceae bacterium]|nr:hypothetical protein [Melioribacteraceae bacterium]